MVVKPEIQRKVLEVETKRQGRGDPGEVTPLDSEEYGTGHASSSDLGTEGIGSRLSFPDVVQGMFIMEGTASQGDEVLVVDLVAKVQFGGGRIVAACVEA